MSPNINWEEVVELMIGDVQEVNDNIFITQKGIIDEHKFYLTKRLYGESFRTITILMPFLYG